ELLSALGDGPALDHRGRVHGTGILPARPPRAQHRVELVAKAHVVAAELVQLLALALRAGTGLVPGPPAAQAQLHRAVVAAASLRDRVAVLADCLEPERVHPADMGHAHRREQPLSAEGRDYVLLDAGRPEATGSLHVGALDLW